ncbi:MAG: AraC family transcriptional regulator, partial [Actinomycetota bacterium]|nr:AraC family transcriptional regulator [Actinomycetota bacterium]
LYVSTQAELPYEASFAPARTHLVILHLDGPVTVTRGRGRSRRSRAIAAGGLFLHPAGRELDVALGGRLETVHAYLSEAVVQEASGCDGPVELAQELGSADPLVEQLMLALDEVVRQWEPTARTYIDHLTGTLAAHLAYHHNVARPAPDLGHRSGLSPRQWDAVRELMDARLAEPLPLTDLAAAATLSVSQFTRQFKLSTGETPHRYLIRLRLEHACRLLRTRSLPIAQIAARCGFSHQEHLTRVMRARLNTTPAAVRG